MASREDPPIREEEIIASGREVGAMEDPAQLISQDLQREFKGNGAPIKVPMFRTQEELMIFMARISEDPWLLENAGVLLFDNGDVPGGSRVGVALIRDHGFWTSDKGCAHLRSSSVRMYPVQYYCEHFFNGQVEPGAAS